MVTGAPRARSLLLALSVTLIGALSTTPSLAATAEQADVTGVEKWATTVALNEVGNHEVKKDQVKFRRGYGDFGGAWCGDFVHWVLEKTNIRHDLGGRGKFNHQAARAWGVYGQRGYGRKRPASTKDAMPGDLIIHNDNNTASTGGHVSMVVQATNDPAWVWTVGGNEGNAVRLRMTNLMAKGGYKDPRSLVTLTEMRFSSINLTRGSSKVGSAQLERVGGGYGPLVRVNGLAYGSSSYTPAQINENYRFEAVHRDTGALVNLAPTAWVSTFNYRNIRLVRVTGGRDSAQVSYPAVSRAGKATSGKW